MVLPEQVKSWDINGRVRDLWRQPGLGDTQHIGAITFRHILKFFHLVTNRSHITGENDGDSEGFLVRNPSKYSVINTSEFDLVISIGRNEVILADICRGSSCFALARNPALTPRRERAIPKPTYWFLRV